MQKISINQRTVKRIVTFFKMGINAGALNSASLSDLAGDDSVCGTENVQNEQVFVRYIPSFVAWSSKKY